MPAIDQLLLLLSIIDQGLTNTQSAVACLCEDMCLLHTQRNDDYNCLIPVEC